MASPDMRCRHLGASHATMKHSLSCSATVRYWSLLRLSRHLRHFGDWYQISRSRTARLCSRSVRRVLRSPKSWDICFQRHMHAHIHHCTCTRAHTPQTGCARPAPRMPAHASTHTHTHTHTHTCKPCMRMSNVPYLQCAHAQPLCLTHACNVRASMHGHT